MIELFIRFLTLDGLIAKDDALFYTSYSPEEEIISGIVQWSLDNKISGVSRDDAIVCWRSNLWDIIEGIKLKT